MAGPQRGCLKSHVCVQRRLESLLLTLASSEITGSWSSGLEQVRGGFNNTNHGLGFRGDGTNNSNV